MLWGSRHDEDEGGKRRKWEKDQREIFRGRGWCKCILPVDEISANYSAKQMLALYRNQRKYVQDMSAPYSEV